MAVIKCKMCGGDIQLAEDKTFGTCEYCGSTMTFPKVTDEQRAAAFNRGNHFRRTGEFDKALAVYERIVAEDDGDAEAHWCCALCRFGIEYVEDPTTYEWLPTCHRVSFDSFLEDVDYLAAVEHSDGITRRQYQKDAAKIAEVQRGILATSQSAEPYDVFISYKELDAEGNRTRDSILAQDIYYQLTEKGWRVFFSRISLEDVPGTQYEPYIFAALNSAKVMVVVGTSAENLNAVWVKNEWSRYLSLMRKDRSKLLLPCYRDMDPYDLPEPLSVLMSYDMGKIGFIQDLIRGVDKVLNAEKPKEAAPVPVQERVIVQQAGGGPNVTALMKRGNMSLEDGDWDKAKDYFNQVLNMDAECGSAYLGLAMADVRAKERSAFAAAYTAADSKVRDSRHVARARRFDPEIEAWFIGLDEQGRQADERERMAREKARAEKIEKLALIRKRNEKAKDMISAGRLCTTAVTVDGTVLAVGDNITGRCDVNRWSDIIAVAAGINETIGLRADGTVISTELKKGQNYGQCNVASWNDLIAISASGLHTVGLRADGTVVSTCYIGDKYMGQCDVSSWRDIVEISASVHSTVGLKSDGTVVLAGTKEYRRDGVLNWTDIVSVSCGADHIVGLKADGTVVAVGSNTCGQSEVSSWTDIVAVSAGTYHTVGLRADGTVVSTEYKYSQKPEWNYGQCNVSSWRNIVAVSAGTRHTVGIRADGTVIATVYSGNPKENHGQCNVYGWRLFNHVETIDDERRAAVEQAEAKRRAAAEKAEAERIASAEKEKAKRKAKVEALCQEKGKLQTELPTIKGLFAGSKKAKIEARLAEIEAELKKLG